MADSALPGQIHARLEDARSIEPKVGKEFFPVAMFDKAIGDQPDSEDSERLGQDVEGGRY